MSRTALFSRRQPGGVFDYVSIFNVQGEAFFVDSGHASTSDSTGYGYNPDAPFATLAYAFSSDVLTANNGDTVFVMPGHAETVDAAGDIAMDIAGVRVIGLGDGASRPTITFATDTTADINISAADITIENILFYCNVDSLDAPLHLTGDDCKFKNVTFRDAASNKEANIWLLASSAADRLEVDGLSYEGLIAGDACTDVIQLNGGTGAKIHNSQFYGKVSVGMVNMNANSYDVKVYDCVFYNESAGLTKNVKDTGGSSTWEVYHCFDGKMGYNFSGGSAAAVAGDDISTLSVAISTVNSIVTNDYACTTATSTGVSTATVIATNTSTGVSTNSVALSTINSIVTNDYNCTKAVSTGVSTNSVALSTINSIATNGYTCATATSTGVSTVTVIATNTSTGVSTVSVALSTVNSIATNAYTCVTATSTGVSTVSVALSTVNSICTNAYTCATATSTGVSTATVIATNTSTGVSTNSVALSTINSIATNAYTCVTATSTGVSTNSVALSTVNSIATNAYTCVTATSTGVSTATVIATNTSTGVSTNSVALSTVNSICTNAYTCVTATSTGVSTNSVALSTVNSIATNAYTCVTAVSTGLSTLTLNTTAGGWRLARRQYAFATDGGGPGTITLFTVSGTIFVQIFGVCQTSLADTTDTATVEVGISGNTAALIALTDSDLVLQYCTWQDAAPEANPGAIDLTGRSFAVTNGADIGLKITNEALTAGVVDFYCIWFPLSTDGNCVST